MGDKTTKLAELTERLAAVEEYLTSPRFPTDVHSIATAVTELHGVLKDVVQGLSAGTE